MPVHPSTYNTSIHKSRLLPVISLFALTLHLLPSAHAQKQNKPLPPLAEDAKGRLVYTPDKQGNRIPDFSYCGYQASEVAIPAVPVKMVVPWREGDATLRIQSAIERVAALPKDKGGFRGAVLLQRGVYNVEGQLKIDSSGVVLRGSGTGEEGTVLLGTGKGRQTLIRITGTDNRVWGKEIKIIDPYVPVNAGTLTLAASGFKTGDNLIVHRPSTKNWIAALHTETFGGGISALGWKPGERDVFWDRRVVQTAGNTLTLDVPLTTALDSTYGGAAVASYTWTGRISRVGVENMHLSSSCDTASPKDEAHRWMAITLENAEDAWVRQVRFSHFAGSAVDVLETARRVTVEDCQSLAPVSETGGQRRYTFLTTGQQTLIQRCYAENGYHDFAVGYCAAGPNAFVQCQSVQPYSFSGAIDSWASGVLFDIVNVDGNALRFGNRGQDGQGAGWTAANSVFWQCTAARVDCYKPPTANNWAFGTWAQFSGDGYWGESNNTITPRSLYYAQLGERLNRDVSDRAQVLFVETNASSSPTVAVANQLTALSADPAPRLSDWIDAAARRQPIPVSSTGIQTIDATGVKQPPAHPVPAPAMQIRNGWVVRGNQVVTGSRQEAPWWSGSVLPADLPKMKPHITRFVPGRTGTGLTDDLDKLTDSMQQRNLVAMEHNYALWYERRRDDHERIRRMDGEVWPPFYEVPFARSGQGTAWDGLSKYDLTKYNTWYWDRLRQFADLADRKGLVLVHQNYFQHNIIEAGAHYADFPWRPVNNINNTGFPEPVPYAGDKRLFMAEQFYDVNHPVRRALHRAYIRQCLDNFKNNTGVIQLTGAEFTGPRHFVAFWLDVVKEWEETGKKEIIGLSATKDVQDSILADAGRAAVVDLIDIRYWHYQADGNAYAPEGGQNLAPRQHARLLKPKASSFGQVYRAVKEYRLKYPGKAVMYSGDGYDRFGWAAFMAGGSLAAIPPVPQGFATAASGMLPAGGDVPMLSGKDGNIVYVASNEPVLLDLSKSGGAYKAVWISAGSGQEIKQETIGGGRMATLKNPQPGAALVWLHK